jgi:hypothetical protein
MVLRNLIIFLFTVGFFYSGYTQPKKGVLVEKELCRADTNYSYAYYLPSYYDFMKRWPVIFIFEPGARGPLGIEVFKEMAEQRGYAIFCSNNARNGPTRLIMDAAEAMFKDVYSRFSLLNERTYLSGFSGGSRVSSMIAAMTGKVNTIIGAGAGFSERIEDLEINFDYYGITSYLDFNYSEMMSLEKKLDSMEVNHAFSIFDGAHDWPPPLQIEMAVLWMEITDMKQGIMDTDETVVKRYSTIMDSLQAAYADSGRFLDQVRSLKNWRNAVSGIGNTERPDSILQPLLDDPVVLQKMAYADALLEQEVSLSKELKIGLEGLIIPYLYEEQPDKYWEDWLIRINEFKADSVVEMQQMGTRIQLRIVANCWMEFYSFMENKRTDKAGKFLHVWEIFDPESLALHWYYAKYFTETNNKKKAVQHLETCRELGMKNYTRLQSDTTFSKLVGYKKFNELIVEMDTLR